MEGDPALEDEPLLEPLGDELLDDELLDGLDVEGGAPEGLGGMELGVVGGCGVVGLLALGQPLNSRQATVIVASVARGWRRVLLWGISVGNVIGIGHLLSAYRIHFFESWAKLRCTQFAH